MGSLSGSSGFSPLSSETVIVTVFAAVFLPSLAVNVTVYWPAAGFSHWNTPAAASKEAPFGIPSAASVTVSFSGSEASTVNEKAWPAKTRNDVPQVITGGLLSETLFSSKVSLGTATRTDLPGTVMSEPDSLIFSRPAFVPSAITAQSLAPVSVTVSSETALFISTAILSHWPGTSLVS